MQSVTVEFVSTHSHPITQYASLAEADFALASFTERYYLHSIRKKLRGFTDIDVTGVQGFEKYDFRATRYGANFVGEIKIREDRDFDFSGSALIEVQKYDSLLEEYRNTGAEPLYLSFWKNGILTVQNLLAYQDLPVKMMKCPARSKGGKRTYVEKPCYLLSFHVDTEVMSYTTPDKARIISAFQAKYIRQN